MPDVVRLRYVGSAPVMAAPLGRQVEPDCIIDFAGTVVPAPGQPEDAIYIESGNPPDLRAWPKTLWRNETVAKKPKE